MLQCVALCWKVLQYVTVYCNVLRCQEVCCSMLQSVRMHCSVLQCAACSVVQCAAVRYSGLQCVAACCSVLQRVAAFFSMLCSITWKNTTSGFSCLKRSVSIDAFLLTRERSVVTFHEMICACGVYE